MPWLISYRFQATYLTDRGRSANNADNAMDVIEETPAEFVIKSRKAVLALDRAAYDPAAGVQRADRVLWIFSALEVSAHQAEQLKDYL